MAVSCYPIDLTSSHHTLFAHMSCYVASICAAWIAGTCIKGCPVGIFVGTGYFFYSGSLTT